jgi:hypothetical protein
MPANILSAITQFLTPSLVTKMASALALDRASTQKTVDAAVPAILSALANLAATPTGARQLSSVIAEQPQNTLANFADLIGGSTRIVDSGKTLISSLLGGTTVNALVSGISKFAGVSEGSSRSVLGMLMPMVLGILGSKQREEALSSGDLAKILASQRNEFAAAMPAKLSEHLNRTGLFDRGGVPPTSTTGRLKDGRSALPVQQTAPTPLSPNWAYWALPLAALVGLGWYFLSGDRSPPEPAARTTAAPTTAVVPVQVVSAANENDVKREATETINALQGHLQGARDREATATLPKLREISGQLDRLGERASQLPADARERITSALKEGQSKVRSTLDSMGSLEAPDLRPALDSLRTKLDALAGTFTGEGELRRQANETISALQGQLQGLKDAGASVALPKLEEMSGQLDRLGERASQLPADARERIASVLKEGQSKVRNTLDSIGPLANAPPGLLTMIDALRTKLDTLADIKAAYFAKGPADSLSLTAYLSRDVYNRAGEKLGAINDFLVGPDGRITAAIIGVGGFLGIGEKEIAIPFSSLQSVRRADTWSIVIDADKAALTNAPPFEPTGERVRFKVSPRQ